MIILGIDPGLCNTGWAVISYNSSMLSYIDSGVIQSAANMPFEQRLLGIFKGITQVIKRYNISSAAIEDTYVNNNYGSSLKLAHARGSAIIAVVNCGISINCYAAKKVKQSIIGNAKADKEQIKRMVQILLPTSAAVKYDANDALAIAICHGMNGGVNVN